MLVTVVGMRLVPTRCRLGGDDIRRRGYHAAMNEQKSRYPVHYTKTIRALLRFALVMLAIGVLSGVSYQESGKKVTHASVPEGMSRLEATLPLALVHGHVILIGVLLPVAMAGMLHLARAHGGSEISRRGLAWIVYTYLPAVSASLALMLYKSYYILLSVRGGKTDLGEIDAAFFGGSHAWRHGIYGFFHFWMGVGIFVFIWCVWRSLRSQRA